jgi:hypothetical protein
LPFHMRQPASSETAPDGLASLLAPISESYLLPTLLGTGAIASGPTRACPIRVSARESDVDFILSLALKGKQKSVEILTGADSKRPPKSLAAVELAEVRIPAPPSRRLEETDEDRIDNVGFFFPVDWVDHVMPHIRVFWQIYRHELA